jgi:signal transduction histidine kinase
LQASKASRPTFQEQLWQAIEQFAEERQLKVNMRSETDMPIRNPPQTREQVQRVVLEALTNVTKHAPDSQVTVTLERQDGQGTVCIQDDGPGFRPGIAAGKPGHFGLKVMQARAERIGGALSIESAPGRGTSITLCWPVSK